MLDQIKTHRWVRIILSLVPVIILSLVSWVLYQELHTLQLQDVIGAAHSISPVKISAAFLLTVLSYLLLTGYDTLALRYISFQMPYRKVGIISFICTAISYTVGFNFLTSSSLRFRLYSGSGLSSKDVTRLIGFSSLGIWLGYFLIGGLLYAFYPFNFPVGFPVPSVLINVSGYILVTIFISYLVWALFIGKIEWRKIKIQSPSIQLTFSQIIVSSLDWAVAAMVLYVLVPANPELGLFRFIGIFMLAQIFGLISNVPGGLGVFETAMLIMLKNVADPASLAGVLLVYRGVYYLVPFLLALIGLIYYEARQQKFVVEGLKYSAEIGFSRVIPLIFSVLTFISGIILLFSGVTPSVLERLKWLISILPLPAVELSHFLGSVVGALLLLLALGLKRRLRTAYYLSLAMLLAGSIFSLLKSLDYEEATFLLVIFILLLPCSKYFYSKTSIWKTPLSKEWAIGTLTVLISITWLGFFSYSHVEYNHELWWQFSLQSEAPRYLRATVGVFSVILFSAVISLVRRKPPLLPLPAESDLELSQNIVRSTGTTYGNLALLGDKHLLFSPNDKAFIMFGRSGNYWVAMGDPVGDPNEFKDLIWKFREMSAQHYDRVVFYEVGVGCLPHYIDLGLSIIKIGEEARVSLAEFSLQGSSKKSLRSTLNRKEKSGYSFEVIPEEQVSEHLPQLRQISDAWLGQKNSKEKKFSLGFFNERYLLDGPVAVARNGDRIIAFTNLWTSSGKEELSVDLMRYNPEHAQGTMDFLFIKLMDWGKQNGYQWFNLGMAPFSGFDVGSMPTAWNRLGYLVYRFGEHFYNFQGLRMYKDKFDPIWTPKYLAFSGGIHFPVMLANIATLISGGLKGVISK